MKNQNRGIHLWNKFTKIYKNEFINYTKMLTRYNSISEKINATVGCCHLARNRPRYWALF